MIEIKKFICKLIGHKVEAINIEYTIEHRLQDANIIINSCERCGEFGW